MKRIIRYITVTTNARYPYDAPPNPLRLAAFGQYTWHAVIYSGRQLLRYAITPQGVITVIVLFILIALALKVS